MKRVVIKVGSHVLSDDHSINEERVEKLCEFIVALMDKFEVILVSSGAISAGQVKCDIPKSSVVNRQMLAAIGQPFLIEIYNKIFARYGICVGQILLTAADFDSRKQTKYAKNVVDALCRDKILPIINENDATAIEEIVYGDNDRLSASVAVYFDADILVILSDIDGYYDSDPKNRPSAKIRPLVKSLSQSELEATPVAGSKFGTGGIVTKLRAANFMLENKKAMFLASGFELCVAREFLLNNTQLGGTLFKGEI